ncbi:hypothetical protein A3K89_08355 [Rhodococcoides kyotonense]|uniref:Uncharacterized protein n=1 Tax=Rhodococcoides kyotonense TaxID=398843 RepID=A0A177YB77_9NOCA|nr:hypothetical protein A3K89_08355 [Rhodococcus kyotonensis]
MRLRDDRKHLLQRHAVRDDRRRRGDHGNHLLLRLRERRRVHRELRRRRGIHRRRHRDDRPVLRRDDPDDHPVRGAPNETASRPGSDEEASSRETGEVRPGREPDGDRPGREPDGDRPGREPDGDRPGQEPDGCRPDEVHPVPDEARAVPPERTSTGCYRREAPSGPASGRERRASELPDVLLHAIQPTLRAPEERVPQVRTATVQPDEPGSGGAPTSAPGWMQPVPRGQPVSALQVLRESAPQVLRARTEPDGVPAWGRDAVHRALRRCWAWVHPSYDRCPKGRPTSRTETTHGYDALPAPRPWTMQI